jgi:formylglycine-generating enzyme required for sulfatase activity
MSINSFSFIKYLLLIFILLPFVLKVSAQTIPVFPSKNDTVKIIKPTQSKQKPPSPSISKPKVTAPLNIEMVLVGDFSIGKYEVTQAQWKAVMGNNPSEFRGENLPVEQVSWDDVQKFLKKLNQQTGKRYRLPTEVEWEYAARGGRYNSKYEYAGSNDIGSVAWYDGNSGGRTHSVGQKLPNALGIYDMSGNVLEFTSDWCDSIQRTLVLLGSSWRDSAVLCELAHPGSSQCTDRSNWNNNLGFRLALSL